jgi:hypothetical protein
MPNMFIPNVSTRSEDLWASRPGRRISVPTSHDLPLLVGQASADSCKSLYRIPISDGRMLGVGTSLYSGHVLGLRVSSTAFLADRSRNIGPNKNTELKRINYQLWTKYTSAAASTYWQTTDLANKHFNVLFILFLFREIRHSRWEHRTWHKCLLELPPKSIQRGNESRSPSHKWCVRRENLLQRDTNWIKSVDYF